MKKKFNILLILAVIPLILSVLSLVSLFDKGFVIYPNQKYTTGVYSDGFSHVENYVNKNNSVELEYTLIKGREYPYVGLFFNVYDGKHRRYTDISSYKYINLKVRADKSRELKIYMLFFLKNFSQPQIYESYRFLEKIFALTNKTHEYKFPLNTFITSLWWYENNKTSEVQIGKPDFRDLGRIQIENSVLLPEKVEDKIIFEYLSFTRSYTLLHICTGIIILLYLSIFITRIILQKQNQNIVITYTPLDTVNISDTETKNIADFITRNYSNPELTVETVYEETGIFPAKISALIKKSYNLSFKQLLNSIRLTEARRLLTETDNQIIEIAFKVGYNTVSHFNRLFKKVENISPKEYRRIHK